MKESKVRWGIHALVCHDCGFVMELVGSMDVKQPGVSRAMFCGEPVAMLVIMCPPVCPECHNLRVVSGEDARGPSSDDAYVDDDEPPATG